MTTSDAAYARARETFARGDRIEMGELARNVGVDRTTLFRWVGNREELLAELIWERMAAGLARADRRARREGTVGADRLGTALLALFAAGGDRSPERRLVARTPELAMRVMTAGKVHERLVTWFAEAIEAEARAGHVQPAHPVRDIAEIVIKSGEAVFWFDVDSGRGVNPAHVTVILEALCPPRRRDE